MSGFSEAEHIQDIQRHIKCREPQHEFHVGIFRAWTVLSNVTQRTDRTMKNDNSHGYQCEHT